MMAAFIVAVRGTIMQAMLLAVAATISHTAIVWVVALSALIWGERWNAETSEPYSQVLSGAIIVALALWMLGRTWRDQRRAKLATEGHHGHHHTHGHHDHDHEHDDHDEVKRIDTGHGLVELSVFEDGGVPPRFRLRFLDHHGREVHPHDETVTVETIRDDGARQRFELTGKGAYLESIEEIAEPHQFTATIRIRHAGHEHAYATRYTEHGHSHAHDHGGLAADVADHQDAHTRAHAMGIKERFAGRTATTGQVIVFGLTGGLLPCPAAVTVLLLCLQLQRFWLGIVLVLSFSVGLALTLMASGIVAAWGTHHVARRWKGFDAFTRRAPYFASGLIMCVGLYVCIQGALSF